MFSICSSFFFYGEQPKVNAGLSLKGYVLHVLHFSLFFLHYLKKIKNKKRRAIKYTFWRT